QSGGEVEFLALTLWDSLDSVKRFAGDDPEVAVVEPEARAVLADFDDFARHYEVAVSPLPLRVFGPGRLRTPVRGHGGQFSDGGAARPGSPWEGPAPAAERLRDAERPAWAGPVDPPGRAGRDGSRRGLVEVD